MPKEKTEKKEKKESSFDLEEETWDKKKIIFGLAVFALLLAGAIGAKMYLLPKSIARQIPIGPAVEGAQTSINATTDQVDSSSVTPTPEKITLPTTEDLQKKIAELQDQITHLSLQDIASSSPQVQQLIQQIQALPNAPANAAKEACIQMCSRL